MMCSDQQKQLAALNEKIDEHLQKNISAVQEDLASVSQSIYKDIEGLKIALGQFKSSTNKRLDGNARDLNTLTDTVSERYLQSTLESKAGLSQTRNNTIGNGLDKSTTNKQN
jgi:hypothetical protein